ncbi:deoxyribodipyrimidine photo-lyase [Rhodovulum kholense]|uniref:Deoxyribodipyrimidine photo-lyase type I n=1 Tax=Rhodovulum kholense TaxID=453584 RepID=A0A8E3APU6_9RHOB|nr:deoxyribodipyrimidine photo-lyase [Rhodovulum kholense]PTW47114.1 deoxyribodipyrimidine photo-lyase type I [Rhodovulum kholense]
MEVTILWLRRDLRLEDHPALARAAAGEGAVLPLYIVDPAVWAAPEASARHWRFVAEGLAALSDALAARGAALQIEAGPPAEVLARCAARWPVTRVLTLDDGTGGDAAPWARGSGIAFEEVRAPRGAALPPPGALRGLDGLVPAAIPGARDLGLGFDPCPGRPRGGRAEAERVLEAALSDPAPERALSAHLAWGTLSAAEVSRAARAAGAGPLTAGLARRARLMRAPTGRGDTPRPPDHAARFAAWEKGETGLPAVDAPMRALCHSGLIDPSWLGLLASAGIGLLGLDPEDCGRVLARLCLDYHPVLHRARMRAAAARPADPLRQARDLDPEGAMLGAWLPELADLPGPARHAPWTWRGPLARPGRRYPAPVIDIATDPARPVRPAPARARRRPADRRQLAFDL